ncbi:unconventional myosin-XV-like [Tropilaelaps mercedesae]|uniref:Unconventional myosin-XV-like n=1 Tax=Tropilaelaps mercedesae TaxID=418985 RepID=A0A1V9Y213_9ACAR|nr:unconventional myosin-XV-like [Tropilaelaps mercedesae]
MASEDQLRDPCPELVNQHASQSNELNSHICCDEPARPLTIAPMTLDNQNEFETTAGGPVSPENIVRFDKARDGKRHVTSTSFLDKATLMSACQQYNNLRVTSRTARRARQYCSQCDYSTSSSQMLQVHLRRTKHQRRKGAAQSVTQPDSGTQRTIQLDEGSPTGPNSGSTTRDQMTIMPISESRLEPRPQSSLGNVCKGPARFQQKSRTRQIQTEETTRPSETEEHQDGAFIPDPYYSCPQADCSFWSHQSEPVVAHVRLKHAELRSVKRSMLSLRRRCPRCPYESAHLGNMRIHVMARHSNRRPHLCHLCGRSFADKSYYNIHMKRHSKDLRYACELCEARFLQPSHLRRHIRARHHQPAQPATSKTALAIDKTTLPNKSATHVQPARSNLASTRDNVTSQGRACSSVYPASLAERSSSKPPVPQAASRDAGANAQSESPFQGQTNEFGLTLQIDRVRCQIFECIDCNTFFLSFHRLKAHVEREHPASLR